jgi:hypothetical protein
MRKRDIAPATLIGWESYLDTWLLSISPARQLFMLSGAPPLPTFVLQLEEARAEWRRRHAPRWT